MARRTKRREWTQEHVRELKTLTRQKTARADVDRYSFILHHLLLAGPVSGGYVRLAKIRATFPKVSQMPCGL